MKGCLERTCDLKHWQADFPPRAGRGYDAAPGNLCVPVRGASLCRWQQKRLPSSTEWELVALASETAPNGRKDLGYQARLLER